MSLFETAIGLLAPADCIICGQEGLALCAICSASEIAEFGERCWRCNSLSPRSRTCDKCRAVGPLSHTWISTNYETTAQQLVRKYKFGHMRAAAKPLAELMAGTFRRYNDASEIDYLVVPVPTATSRIRERGFGHSEQLAKSVAQKLRLQSSNRLRRLDQTRQLGSSRPDRLTQLAGSFALKRPGQVRDRHILLIDDVITTGGTLISAAKTLKAAGAKQVNALVFAKRL
jgi:ComF family protein